MTDNSLDDFVQNTNQPNPVNHPRPQPNGEHRRLRKIKRPRVRPSGDMPQAPKKVMPENIPNPTVEDEVSAIPSVSEEKELTSQEDSLDALVENDENEVSASGTELVNIKDIKGTHLDNPNGSSYVIDALPPDLDYEENSDSEDIDTFDDGGDYIKKPLVYAIAGACFIVGLFIGKTLFATQTIEKHGLEGVVINQDVPAGRPRCGRTDKSQACVFYVMNWYKQELNGRDFYRLAAQLTGREEYMIETDNLLYANVKIKPGHIAQLNIPALK